MNWVVHPLRPRDFPRPSRCPSGFALGTSLGPREISRAEGNLEVGGDVQPNTSRFEAVYGHSLIINPSLGMYQEIHPCRASSTYSVKINTSLPMMREWVILPLKPLQIGRRQCLHPCTDLFNLNLHQFNVHWEKPRVRLWENYFYLITKMKLHFMIIECILSLSKSCDKS